MSRPLASHLAEFPSPSSLLLLFLWSKMYVLTVRVYQLPVILPISHKIWILQCAIWFHTVLPHDNLNLFSRFPPVFRKLIYHPRVTYFDLLAHILARIIHSDSSCNFHYLLSETQLDWFSAERSEEIIEHFFSSTMIFFGPADFKSFEKLSLFALHFHFNKPSICTLYHFDV